MLVNRILYVWFNWGKGMKFNFCNWIVLRVVGDQNEVFIAALFQ
jgi:hypothetical protein